MKGLSPFLSAQFNFLSDTNKTIKNGKQSFSLSGKTILITGASSGIGKAVAQECAAAGATCLITARNKQRLQQTLESLVGEGHQSIIADLTDESAITRMVENLPKLDGVVNCAGVVETKMLKFTEEEDLQKMFETMRLFFN